MLGSAAARVTKAQSSPRWRPSGATCRPSTRSLPPPRYSCCCTDPDPRLLEEGSCEPPTAEVDTSSGLNMAFKIAAILLLLAGGKSRRMCCIVEVPGLTAKPRVAPLPSESILPSAVPPPPTSASPSVVNTAHNTHPGPLDAAACAWAMDDLQALAPEPSPRGFDSPCTLGPCKRCSPDGTACAECWPSHGLQGGLCLRKWGCCLLT